MLVGGALVNALAFSGSNYLFTMLKSSGVDEERKRHDKAVEQLQAAQASWSRKRTERLDLSTGNSAGKAMLLRRSGMLTPRCRNMRRSPGTTSTPSGQNPSSPTFITRVTAKKTARSPLSSWGWPRPALWPTNSPRSEVRLNLKPFSATLYHGSSRRALMRHKIPLAHTMIDIAQKSLELWRQDEKTAMRFAAGMLAGPTNLRATTGQLPEPVASACWRLVRLLEYLSSNGRQ